MRHAHTRPAQPPPAKHPAFSHKSSGYKNLVASTTIGRDELRASYTHNSIDRYLTAKPRDQLRMFIPLSSQTVVERMERTYKEEVQQAARRNGAATLGGKRAGNLKQRAVVVVAPEPHSIVTALPPLGAAMDAVVSDTTASNIAFGTRHRFIPGQRAAAMEQPVEALLANSVLPAFKAQPVPAKQSRSPFRQPKSIMGKDADAAQALTATAQASTEDVATDRGADVDNNESPAAADAAQEDAWQARKASLLSLLAETELNNQRRRYKALKGANTDDTGESARERSATLTATTVNYLKRMAQIYGHFSNRSMVHDETTVAAYIEDMLVGDRDNPFAIRDDDADEEPPSMKPVIAVRRRSISLTQSRSGTAASSVRPSAVDLRSLSSLETASSRPSTVNLRSRSGLDSTSSQPSMASLRSKSGTIARSRNGMGSSARSSASGLRAIKTNMANSILAPQALPIKRRNLRKNLLEPPPDTESAMAYHYDDVIQEMTNQDQEKLQQAERNANDAKQRQREKHQQLSLANRSTQLKVLENFIQLANPRKLPVGRSRTGETVDFTQSDLWSLDDFIQSPYVFMDRLPTPMTMDYAILEQALLFAFHGDYYHPDLRQECALLLSELSSAKGMLDCKAIYTDLLLDYCAEEENMTQLHHSREALCSARAMLHLGEVSAEILTIYLSDYEEAETDSDLAAPVQLLSGFCNTPKYPELVALVLELLDDPRWRMRCMTLRLLQNFVDFEDKDSVSDVDLQKNFQRQRCSIRLSRATDDLAAHLNTVNAVAQLVTIVDSDGEDLDAEEAELERLRHLSAEQRGGGGQSTKHVSKSISTGKTLSKSRSGSSALMSDKQDGAFVDAIVSGTELPVIDRFSHSLTIGQLVLDRIVDAAHSDWNPNVRTMAKHVAVRIGKGRSVLHWLLSCLSSTEFRKRMTALRTLLACGRIFDEARPHFLKCIGDMYTTVRREACKLACEVASNDGPLLEALRDRFDDQDWRVRAYAVKAVGLCGNTGANVRELLLWYLNHEHNPAVLAETANACRTLAIVNDTSISTALADLVDNTEGVTRRCIEEALATSNALVHKSEGASEALDTISTLVKTMGTKSAITMQVCNMDNKEYEEWISME